MTFGLRFSIHSCLTFAAAMVTHMVTCYTVKNGIIDGWSGSAGSALLHTRIPIIPKSDAVPEVCNNDKMVS